MSKLSIKNLQLAYKKTYKTAMSKLKEYIAANIKKFRKDKKITQSYLAELCGTSTNYIALIETCKRFPRDDMIEKIAEALNIEIFELFMEPNIFYRLKDNKKEKFIKKIIEFIEKEL